MPISKDQLKELYTDKKSYQDRVKRRVDELEKAGWSLPVYRRDDPGGRRQGGILNERADLPGPPGAVVPDAKGPAYFIASRG